MLYWQRWLMLALFTALCLNNNIIWITFAPITKSTTKHFDVGELAVNLQSIVYMVVTLLLIIPASWLLDNKGLRTSFTIAAILNGVGAAIRFASVFLPNPFAFYMILVGQTISGLCQPIVLPAPPKLAAQWFGDDERTIATGIGGLGGVIGIGFGYGLSFAVMGFSSTSSSGLAQKFELLLGIQAGISVLISTLSIVLFRGYPPTPPSASANSEKDDFITSAKTILKNKDYLICVFTLGPGFGAASCLFSVLEQLVDPYGYSQAEAALMGLIMISSGLVGAIVVGAFLDYSRRYKEFMIVNFCIAVALMVGFSFILRKDFLWELLVACGFVGCGLLVLLPIVMEAAIEVTFPAPEAVVTGIIMLVGNIFGVILIVLSSFTIDGKIIVGQWSMIGTAAIICIISFFFNGKYKRLEFEKQNEESKPINSP